jgi:N-acetylglucosaminyldiphosphoundecaprenol N-acetyl-beta-D-mannosaminyltransferase
LSTIAAVTSATTGVPTTSLPGRRITLFGLPIDDLSMEETLDRVDAFVAEGGTHQHVVLNVSKIVQASRDSEMRSIVAGCDLVNVDGQPVVWAARLLGHPLKARVTGVDLMEHLIGRASKRGYRLYFLGARPAVVEAVVERARRENPGAVIAGWRDGYWSPDEESRVVRAIADARPDILFVAIGSPSKERFIARWKDTIAAPFLMGVGGSFDIYAGATKRAPGWVQRIGFEWLFRLSQEPRRLWRRYLGDAPAFLRLVIRELRSARHRQS